MSKFGSKEEIVSSIQALFENIQTGSLTADEMETLVGLTRELHERALILRYKSYEEKIFGVSVVPMEVEIEETMIAMEETLAEEEAVLEEPHILSFEEVEEEILEHEKQEVVNDEPVFDFDMFEKAEEDIFSPEMVIEPTPELEASIFNEPIVEEVNAEPEMSESIADESFEVESTPIFSEPEPIAESAVEIDADIFNRYSNTDDSLSSRLMSSKLQTLVGCFGLNDKLQCIRELFQGSSESFNQAIDQLDNQPDFSAAKRVLAQYAQQYSWDLESNLTAEFIQKVERRYL